jgi:RHS repeat-associated protein
LRFIRSLERILRLDRDDGADAFVGEETTTLPVSSLSRTIRRTRSVTMVTGDPNPTLAATILETVKVNSDDSTETLYDRATSTTTTTTAEGRTSTRTLDSLGRVVTISVPDIEPINIDYDANGRVETITQGSVVGTHTPPDVLPGTDATTYDYNLDREITLITRPDADTIDFDYDTAGRLTTTTFPRGVITTSYNAITGQIETMTAPGNEQLDITWDGPLLMSTTWSGTVSGSESFSYNDKFLVETRQTNASFDAGFFYNQDFQLSSASTNVSTLSFAYSSTNGLPIGTALGAVTTTRSYDDFGAPESDLAEYSGTDLLLVEYMRDKLGRITQKVETLGATTTTFDYHYTLEGFLDEVKTDGTVSAEYTYDDNGNRLSGPQSSTSCTYDDQDRLTSCADVDYTYTDNGELESRTDTILSQTTTYSYDALGNLVQVVLPSSTQIDYVVDAKNRRVGKKISGVLVQGFLWENDLRIAAELDGSGNVAAKFIYGARPNVPEFMETGTGTYRFIHDHLGSPRLVVDVSTGAVVQEMQFDEFGNVLVDTNPGFQPFGFAGGLYDPDTELVRFGARDYDPQVGRWTAKDPIRFAGGDTNLYAYAFNDPISLADVDGRNVGRTIYAIYLELLQLGFCQEWHYDRNQNQEGMCPETREECSPGDFYTFQESAALHCGFEDVRGWTRSPMEGVQCIYTQTGEISDNPECGGTWDYAAPPDSTTRAIDALGRYFAHGILDVLPYALCGNAPPGAE